MLSFAALQIAGGNEVPFGTTREIALPEQTHAIAIRIGQRIEQDGVDHAENGRVGADAEGQSYYGRECKGGITAQNPESVSDVLTE